HEHNPTAARPKLPSEGVYRRRLATRSIVGNWSERFLQAGDHNALEGSRVVDPVRLGQGWGDLPVERDDGSSGAEQGVALWREECRFQCVQSIEWQGELPPLVALRREGVIRGEAGQVHKGPAQILQTADRRPNAVARQGGDEMVEQVVPEP